MPTPNKGESEKDFVSRCMSYPDMQRYEPKQRAAICYSKFRDEAVHPDFQRIISLFFKRYKVDEAIEKFGRFIMRNSLNLSKAYNPKVQFQESFEWVEPLIQQYTADAEAKYYLVRALTANISMNNNDYSDFATMQSAAPTLSWRPVNINHDHNRWLPYPRTRVDFSSANELSVEATLRVDNRDLWLQKLLDSGKIVHPSIEGRPSPQGYHFTGMALLDKGVELPGDPLTEILPLAFNESVGKSICEFKGGKMVCECDTKQSEVKNNLKESVKQAIKEVFEEEEKPMLKTPEQSSPNAEKPPKEPEECPTGFHWDGQQCVPNASGDSAKSPMVKMPGPKPAMYEQDVPPATNAPSTVGKDDTATCPENHHWDPDANKCVPDVKQECEAGWHFDVALEKCVPDNPQVNERLEIATLRVEAMHARDDAKKAREQANMWKCDSAEKDKKLEEYIKINYGQETLIKQLREDVLKHEKRWDRKDEECKGSIKEKQNLIRDKEQLTEDRDSWQTKATKEREARETIMAENKKVSEANVQLSTDLTESRQKEVQLTKDLVDTRQYALKAKKEVNEAYGLLKEALNKTNTVLVKDKTDESQPQTT